jgi:hypothetical protein
VKVIAAYFTGRALNRGGCYGAQFEGAGNTASTVLKIAAFPCKIRRSIRASGEKIAVLSDAIFDQMYRKGGPFSPIPSAARWQKLRKSL